ncbi:MAG: O-antigen ligase family protein [Patescibacteria group bacterium]
MEAVLIIIFTLVFAYIAWRKLDWAICLAILFSPVYLIRFTAGFLPMTILEVMLLVIAAVWGLKTLFKVQSVSWPWKWLLILFVLAGTIAVIISPDKRQALGLWKAYIIEPALFFLVFVNTIKTKEQVRSVIWSFGAAVVVIGYVALIQYVGLLHIPSPYGLEHPQRATSVFPFPTAVGKFIGPILAMFISFWLVRVRPRTSSLWDAAKRHIFTGGVVLFGVIGLLFSFSRGAVIGVAAAMLFASFFSVRRKWIWLTMLFVLVACFIIPFTRHEIISVVDVKDASADVHVVMWKGAARIIKANPILGTGLASFPVVYEKYKEASHTEFFPNPDELYLTLWIEMGLLGLLVFIWLVVKYFHDAWRAARSLINDNSIYAMMVGLMAAMVALLAHGFFDTPYFKNDLAIIFWTLVGLAVVLPRISKADTTPLHISEH